MLNRDQLVSRAIRLSVLSIVLGAAMGATAIVAALTGGSLSLLGSGFDAVVDSTASFALVWRFAIEARQPHRAERVQKIAEGHDRRHPPRDPLARLAARLGSAA
jgi:hypothetical protein